VDGDPRRLISANWHAALLEFQLTGNIADEATRVVPVLAAVQAAAAAHPQIQIAETGDAIISKAVNDTVFRDLRRAEALSFPITLVVRPAGQSRVWTVILDRVLAHPALTASAAASILVVLALPVLHLHTAEPGVSDLPQNTGLPLSCAPMMIRCGHGRISGPADK